MLQFGCQIQAISFKCSIDLKHTDIDVGKDVAVTVGVNLTRFPTVRQGLKPLPQSESPLKRTDEFFSLI
jgi:hypothetical protein